MESLLAIQQLSVPTLLTCRSASLLAEPRENQARPAARRLLCLLYELEASLRASHVRYDARQFCIRIEDSRLWART